MMLNLGCGLKKRAGWINADLNRTVSPDVVLNLEEAHLPFGSDLFRRVVCDNVLEHVSEVQRLMEEIFRVARDGAEVEIYTPHFSSDDAVTDITHRRAFGYRSFLIFEAGRSAFNFYTPARYRTLQRRIRFGRLWRIMGLELLANRFPAFYEAHLAYIFRAHSLFYLLEVAKGDA
jgi:SAM-dependent methyltransferase